MYSYGLTFQSQLGFGTHTVSSASLCDPSPIVFGDQARRHRTLSKGKDARKSYLDIDDLGQSRKETYQSLRETKSHEKVSSTRENKNRSMRASQIGKNVAKGRPEESEFAKQAWDARVDRNRDGLFDRGLEKDQMQREYLRNKNQAGRDADLTGKEQEAWNDDVKIGRKDGLFGPPPGIALRRKKKSPPKKKVKPFVWRHLAKRNDKNNKRPGNRKPSNPRAKQEKDKKLTVSKLEADEEDETTADSIVIHSPRQSNILIEIAKKEDDQEEEEEEEEEVAPKISVKEMTGKQQTLCKDEMETLLQAERYEILDRVEELVNDKLSKYTYTYRQQEKRPEVKEKSKAYEKPEPVESRKAREKLEKKLKKLITFEDQIRTKWQHLENVHDAVAVVATASLEESNISGDDADHHKDKNVVGPIFENLDQFVRHRNMVEASLTGTGMSQHQIVESVADILYQTYLTKVSMEILESCDDLAEDLFLNV